LRRWPVRSGLRGLDARSCPVLLIAPCGHLAQRGFDRGIRNV